MKSSRKIKLIYNNKWNTYNLNTNPEGWGDDVRFTVKRGGPLSVCAGGGGGGGGGKSCGVENQIYGLFVETDTFKTSKD